MKRRVLNAASNKKALRQCSATSGARAPFRILCDSSFLRVAFDYFRHYRKASENITNKRDLEATLPSIETLFTELLGTQKYFLQTTLESQEQFQNTYQHSHSNTGAKKFQQQQNLENQLALHAKPGNTQAAAPAQAQAKKPVHPPNPKIAAEAQTFLRKFELVGSSIYSEYAKQPTAKKSLKSVDEVADDETKAQTSVRKNEHKALIETLKEIAETHKTNTAGSHPLSSYFVATLNHDMRALLKNGDVTVRFPIPTIRMTFNPWLLWLDAGEISPHREQLQKGATEGDAPTAAAPKLASSTFKNIGNRADKAFLEHLAKESSAVAAKVSARDKFMSSGHGGRLKKTTASPQQKSGHKKLHSASANSNPLAKKPKRQRETIVSSDEVRDKPSKSQRPEKPQ